MAAMACEAECESHNSASQLDMNMKNLGINHYNLRAPRALLESLRVFYCEIVGLRVGVRPPLKSSGYWLYAGERDVLHLSEATDGEDRKVGVATTFDHVAFTCARRIDFQEALDRRGIPYEVARVPQTGQFQFFLADPAGNGVELIFLDEQD
jgi:catechol-2,3-dioxygenase